MFLRFLGLKIEASDNIDLIAGDEITKESELFNRLIIADYKRRIRN